MFGEPLRVTFAPGSAGSTLKLRCILHGKNVRRPIEQELTLCVVGPGEAPSTVGENDDEDN